MFSPSSLWGGLDALPCLTISSVPVLWTSRGPRLFLFGPVCCLVEPSLLAFDPDPALGFLPPISTTSQGIGARSVARAALTLPALRFAEFLLPRGFQYLWTAFFALGTSVHPWRRTPYSPASSLVIPPNRPKSSQSSLKNHI
jgi:hypothetical protein